MALNLILLIMYGETYAEYGSENIDSTIPSYSENFVNDGDYYVAGMPIKEIKKNIIGSKMLILPYEPIRSKI